MRLGFAALLAWDDAKGLEALSLSVLARTPLPPCPEMERGKEREIDRGREKRESVRVREGGEEREKRE